MSKKEKSLREYVKGALSSYTCGGMSKVPSLWFRALLGGVVPHPAICEKGEDAWGFPIPKGSYMMDALASMSDEEIQQTADDFFAFENDRCEEDENYLLGVTKLHPEAIVPEDLAHHFAGFRKAEDGWKAVPMWVDPACLPADWLKRLCAWYKEQFPKTAILPPQQIKIDCPQLCEAIALRPYGFWFNVKQKEIIDFIKERVETALAKINPQGWRCNVIFEKKNKKAFTAQVQIEGGLPHDITVNI